MKNIFLTTQNVSRFREAMQVLADADHGQPGLGMAYGSTGYGKTEAAREYAMRTNAAYFRVLEGWTPCAMLGELCMLICDMRQHSTERNKRQLIRTLSATRKTILVDEADRFENIRMIEHLRDLHDLTGAPIMLIGEPKLFSMIHSRDRIRGRMRQSVAFAPITTEDIILYAIKAAGLTLRPEAAAAIQRRTNGDFRLVHLDILDLERMGRANNTTDVTAEAVKTLASRTLRGPQATERRAA